ncbi:hypothetical protein [Methylocucumis oryzae]|uniref:hypothetical protein n=1 Tax=Methylocucumis oryzae TaxID=1632867 RepID=UPI001038C75D|nr:hypothetical protein [Methylocucumis oryzae]
MAKSSAWLAAIMYLCAGYSLWAHADDIEPELPASYQWGRGLTWPWANLNIGGYFNASHQQPEMLQEKTTLDELSAFITWSPHQRLRFFAEVEVNEWLSTVGIDTLDNAIRAERLYADLLLTETTTLRLGKFLTPVGRWNVTHAAPLIWTTTRPLVTERRLFTSHASGVMLTQRFVVAERNLNISFYADDSADLDVLDNELGFENGLGGRIEFEISDHLQLGASFIDFKNKTVTRKTRNDLYGIDFLWKKDGYELELEAIYRSADDNQGEEQGLYLQSVIPLPYDFYLINRYEHINGTHRFLPTDTDIGVSGLAWRPFTPLVFKAEYLYGQGNEFVAPSGFFASIAMFF